MPVIGSTRKQYSEFVKATTSIETDAAVNFHFARQTIDAASDTDIAPIGVPVMWDDGTSEWQLFTTQDDTVTAAVVAGTDSTLPNGAKFAFIVGPKEGKGINEVDVTIDGTTGTEVTVLFRGDAAIAEYGITWDGSVNAAAQTIFRTEIEKQGIAIMSNADAVTPYFVEA